MTFFEPDSTPVSYSCWCDEKNFTLIKNKRQWFDFSPDELTGLIPEKLIYGVREQ